MARHLAAGPRMDGFGCGAGLGTGPSHHRPMGRCLWPGWAKCLDFRAVRGRPALGPGAAGGVAGSGPRIACGSGRRSGQLELEGGPPVRLGAVRHLPEPQQLSELPPFSRGQALPGCSPDFNADEAIWGWVREEATGNLCLGTGSWCGRR